MTVIYLFTALLFSSEAQMLYEFTDPQHYTYSLDQKQVLPGFSANNVAQGFFIGTVFAPSPVEPKPKGNPLDVKIEEYFQFEIKTGAQYAEQLEQIKKQVSSELANNEGATGNLEPSADSTESRAEKVQELNWPDYEACALRMLPYLKKGLAIRYGASTQEQKDAHYLLVKSILDENSNIYGMVCGRLLGDKLSLMVRGEVDNIKVMTAFLKRKGEDRDLLLTTLIASHSINALPKTKGLFTYYFLQQFFTAALSTKPLPSFAQMNQEIESSPQYQPLRIFVGGKWVEHQIVTEYKNTQSLTNEGLKKVAEILK